MGEALDGAHDHPRSEAVVGGFGARPDLEGTGYNLDQRILRRVELGAQRLGERRLLEQNAVQLRSGGVQSDHRLHDIAKHFIEWTAGLQPFKVRSQQSVRIHLDEVERLGTFIELEAVAPPDSDLDHEYRLVAELRDALGVTDERLVALGYAAQLLRASGDPDAS